MAVINTEKTKRLREQRLQQNSTQVTIWLEEEMLEQVRERAENNRSSVSEIVATALQHYLNQVSVTIQPLLLLDPQQKEALREELLAELRSEMADLIQGLMASLLAESAANRTGRSNKKSSAPADGQSPSEKQPHAADKAEQSSGAGNVSVIQKPNSKEQIITLLADLNELREQGLSFSQVAEILNQRGWRGPQGGVWNKANLFSWLRRNQLQSS